jgi:hypothetical protein
MTAEQTIDQYLNQIIDCNHKWFKPNTDEELVEETDEYAFFTRTFKHKTGQLFKMSWKVYHGTPETVRTEFLPAVRL